MDPLEQFKIKTLMPIYMGGYDFSFTNASFSMLLSVFLCCGVLYYSVSRDFLIPNRFQITIELLSNWLLSVVNQYIGEKEGKHFFPYIFSLFLFLLFGNLIGLFPYCFTFTSHLIVTFVLALLIFTICNILGVIRHGWKFLKIFLPDGIPIYIAPLFILVELVSYLSRPISLSVRLFANMIAGHIMMKIFAIFTSIFSLSKLFPLFVFPFFVNIILFPFELLVSILQAYVFSVLTCIYLNDALNLH